MTDEELNKSINETEIDEREKYPYNYNPFTPTGRLGRGKYFITILVLNVLAKIFSYIPNTEDIILLFIVFILLAFILLLQLFAVKKRFMDITFNTSKSIGFTVLFFFLFLIPLVNIIAGLSLLLAKGKYDKKMGE